MTPEPARLQAAEFAVSWRPRLLKHSLQLYLLGLFLLVPAHEGWYHFVLKPLFHGRGALLYPEHLLVAVLAVLFWKELLAAARSWRVELILLGFYTVAYGASVVANPATLAEASRSFPVALILPVIVALLMTAAKQRFGVDPGKELLPWLFGGIALVCALGVVAYLVSFGIPRSFHEFVYVFRTYRSLFGAKGGVWYGDLTMGNYNVFAACLLPGFLLWLGWWQEDSPGRWGGWAARAGWLALVATNFYICYSRGSIITLNACAVLLLLLSVGVHGRRRRQVAGIAALLLFDLLIIIPPGAVDHWRGLLRPSETNSAVQRLRQWREVAAPSDQLTDPAWVARQVQEAPESATSGATERGVPQQDLQSLALGARIGKPTTGTPSSTPSSALGTSNASGTLRYYLFGLGPGTYGLVVGFGANANTHNLFINQFVTSGVVGFLAFVALYGRLLVRGWPRRPPFPCASDLRSASWVGLVAIGSVGILSQYEFGYLGTSTGGVLFWICAVLSCSPWSSGAGHGQPREAQPSGTLS